MFDDPKKALARMQEELLAAEQTNEEWEESQEYEDPEDTLEEIKSFLRREEWEEREREPLSQRYLQAEPEEDFELYLDEEPEEPKKKHRRRSGGFLVAVAILEMLAALALLGWWLWLR